MTLLRCGVLLILSLCMAGCPKSTLNLHQGISNFKAQNYRAAFVRLMPEAKKGNADAQYAVGYMYYYGQGVVEDRDKAWDWISKAAKQDQPDAISALKLMKKERRHPYSKK